MVDATFAGPDNPAHKSRIFLDGVFRESEMKFALVNGERREAQPDLSGQCPTCDHSMTAKCGDVKVWHWAHKKAKPCDPWWENETEWHRAWKGQFPIGWQEVAHCAANGERHIADVMTAHGWAIEFQHSPLKQEERQARNAFYGKLVWVVDGKRRKKDAGQLIEAWDAGRPAGQGSPVRRVISEVCVLLHEWKESCSPVLFDLGEDHPLFWRLAMDTRGAAYMIQLPRNEFIEIHGSVEKKAVHDEFSEMNSYYQNQISNYIVQSQQQRRVQLDQVIQKNVSQKNAWGRRRMRF